MSMRKPLGISALLAVFGLLAYSVFNLPSAFADSNLLEDPGFETSLSNFEPNQSGTSVNFTTTNPISGSRSLVINISGYGDSVLWAGRDISTFATKRSSQLTFSAHIRSTIASASQISLCGLVDYTNGQSVQDCNAVSGSVGDKGVVTVTIPLNSSQDLDRVRVGVFQEGSARLQNVLLDDASVVLAGISLSDPNPTPAPTPVNGICGSSNNTTLSSAPTTGLCSTGSASSVSGSGPWSWTCAGENGGTTASCSAQMVSAPAPTPVNGVCGSSNNTTLSSAPTTGLCSTGSASSVSGSGPWSWTCAGSNGGTTASCSAQFSQTAPVTYALTVSKTGNGTVTSQPAGISCGTACSASFANNTSVTLTASPATGNTFSGWTGACSGTGTCTVSMTAARTVAATFVAATTQPPSTVTGDNLVQDPGFELTTSDFEPNQGGTSVNVTTVNPISGARSLVINIAGYGDSILWNGRNFSNLSTKRSSQLTASIKARVTTASASKISFCVLVDYVSGSSVQNCTNTAGTVGDKTLSLNVALDNTRDLDRVRVGIFQEGSAALQNVLLDSASVVVDGVTIPAVPTPVNGVCGSSNNTTLSSAPTTGLCSTGSASSVTGSGPWSWTCTGSNGGTTATCSAQTSQTNPNPTPTPAPSTKFTIGQRVQTNAGVNVRSAAGTSAAVVGTQAVGALGTVSGGPEAANGYNWWQVNYDAGADGYSAEDYLDAYSTSPTPSPTSYTLTVSKTGNGTVTSQPSGITCGATCSASFSANASVTLTAAAATGNTFSGWTGACSGTGVCTVSMTAARTVAATFSAVSTASNIRPLATANPRILLNDSATLSRLQAALAANTAGAARFRTMVNNELASPGTNYGFQAWFAALMYKLTGTASYGTFAVNKIDAFVTSEEALINAGQRPAVAGDSFLEVGDMVGDVALVYDWANDRLTASQKTRWVNYMNTVLNNLWGDPDAVKWGGVSHPWSGWSLNDPFNNYYYSFLEATMFTGLATYGDNPQAQQWINKFYDDKITAQLIPAMNTIPGGGSLEGTGYGTALKRLFKLYFWWEKSTGVNISNQTPHTLNSMFWWLNSMAPSLDKFVPTGDQSRDATASLYDYQRDLLQNLISLYPNERVAGAAKQMLAQSSVTQMQYSMNFWSDFINDWPNVAAQPLSILNTTYFGTGTGNFYSRSAWNTSAIMVHTIAGLYDQSHAHKDQGSFMLNSAGAWLFDDANRRSNSGIEQDEEMHNLVRFGTGSSVIRQTAGKSSQILALSDGSLFSYELMDTRPMYTDPYTGQYKVAKSEREMVFIKSGAVVLFDRATANTAGLARTFQLQMAAAPFISGNQLTYTNGTQRADVWRLSPANVPWTTVSLFSGSRAEAVDTNGTQSLFLHVVGVNNKVTSAVADNTATETGARITFSDGSVATIRFSNTGHGGTLQLVNGSGTTQFNGPLPTTVNTFPLYQ